MNEMRAPSIVPSLERATHAVALWLERSLGDAHLSQAEAHVLAYLAPVRQCSINDLHSSFGHKRSTLTSILDRLEGRGLVRRAAHPASRRLVLVQLTDSGERAAAQIGALLHELEARIVVRAGAADIAAFLRVVAAIEEDTRGR
jgi:DNA-binding MarR family transcriptional regulator